MESETQANVVLIRQEVKEKLTQYENSCLELGRLLNDINNLALYKPWGFVSFEDYVKTELGFEYRRAAYHMSIWNNFGVRLGVTEDKIKQIGWTKAGMLTGLVSDGIIDKTNVDEWIDKAKNTTVRKLNDEVKEKRNTKPTTVNVIQPFQKQPSLVNTIHRVSLGLYENQHANYQRALEIASKIASSDKSGHLLDVICLYFLAGHTDKTIDKDHTLTWFINQLQDAFKVNIVAFKTKDDLVETLKTLTDETTNI
jgi:hypothetical protein